MTINELENYVKERSNEGMTKIDFSLECDPDGLSDTFYVVKTKETYVFGDESEADAKINEARTNAGFAGCDKKFKAGKMNKAGEVTKPDTYTVVIKLTH